MNCQRFIDVVSDLARGQMMEADVRTDALVHVESCERCNEHLTHEQALTKSLRELSIELQTKQAPEALELQLRKAFREQHASTATVVPIANSSRRYWLAVAAAVLLFVAGVVVFRIREAQPTPERQIITQSPDAAGPQKSSSPEVVVNGPGNDSPREIEAKPRRRHVASARRKSQNRTDDTLASNHVREIATEFIPIGYSNSVSLQDGGQIVRVELPRSALVRFGLPVNMDRMNEKVKADVWVGVDGLAHAIRFVQ